jgi:hypothetical protein
VVRHMLFFGDEHTQYKIHNSPNIIQVTTLIKKLIRNSPHCIDLFSENPPYEKRAKGKALQKYGSPLGAIRKEFGNCPAHNMKLTGNDRCKYNNLRYHNWDIRFKRHEIFTDKYLANPYDEIFMKSRKEYNKIIKKLPKKDIIYYLLGFTEKISKSREKQIDRHFNIVLDKYNEKESFANAVTNKDLLNERRKLIRKEYNKCMKSVKFPKDLLETFTNSYDKLNDIDFTLVFTDFYMICRMFMNFDTNKKTPKFCPTSGENNFKTPRYMIIYGGHAHIKNVVLCLTRLFGKNNFYPEFGTKSLHYNKLIKINSLYDKDKKIYKSQTSDTVTINELFKDFYE